MNKLKVKKRYEWDNRQFTLIRQVNNHMVILKITMNIGYEMMMISMVPVVRYGNGKMMVMLMVMVISCVGSQSVCVYFFCGFDEGEHNLFLTIGVDDPHAMFFSHKVEIEILCCSKSASF